MRWALTLGAIGVFLAPAASAVPLYASGAGTNPRYFDGFELRVVLEVELHDRREGLDDAAREIMAAQGPETAEAVGFFFTGEHPYRRLLAHVDRSRRGDQQGQGPSGTAAVARLGQVTIALYLRPGTPQAIADKLAVDFLLAQRFRPGQAALKIPPPAGLNNLTTELQPLVRLAAIQPDVLRAIGARRALVGTRWSSVDPDALFRLHCVAVVLSGKRLGPAWIAEASRRHQLWFLLQISSDRDAADVADMVRGLGDRSLIAAAQPLVPSDKVPPPGPPAPPPPADQVADPDLRGEGLRFYRGFHAAAFSVDAPRGDLRQSPEETIIEDEPTGLVAYEFFLSGDHPYASLRAQLDTDRQIHKSSYADRKANGVRLDFGLVDLTIYLRPGTPAIVGQKVAIDFLLAQLARPPESEFFASYNEDRAVEQLSAAPEALTAGALFGVIRFVGVSDRRATFLAGLNDQNDPGGIARVRVRGLDAVLTRKPFGADLIAAARKTSDPDATLGFLLLIGSDVNAGERAALLAAMRDRAAIARYQPLAR